MWMMVGGLAFVVLICIFAIIRASSQIKTLNKNLAEQTKQARETFALLANKSTVLEQQISSTNIKLPQLEKTTEQLSAVLQQHQKNQQQQLDVIKELNNKILLLEQENTANPMYTRAKKLIELGADVDEIVKECELSRAEAELLISINKESKSA